MNSTTGVLNDFPWFLAQSDFHMNWMRFYRRPGLISSVALAEAPIAVGVDWTPKLAMVPSNISIPNIWSFYPLEVVVCIVALVPGTHICVRLFEEGHPLELDKPFKF